MEGEEKQCDNNDSSNIQPPPLYGSQKYWEQRYQKLNSMDVVNQLENNNKLSACEKRSTKNRKTKKEEEVNDEIDDDNPSPFHAWYFTFEELVPILMPLVIDEYEKFQQNLSSNHAAASEKEEEEDDDEKMKTNSAIKSDGAYKNVNDNHQKAQNNRREETDNDVEETEDEEEETENDDAEENDVDEWEEVPDDYDIVDEEDDDEIDEPRQKLTINGPISVLEIGCGDVPLGIGLVNELKKLQVSTGTKSTRIVEKILCTDYSPSVIEVLKRLHKNKRKLSSSASSLASKRIAAEGSNNAATTTTNGSNNQDADDNDDNGGTDVPIEFVVADARKLPYANESFHLLLEKGTMDALMSDPKVGTSNCIQLVTECARVLAIGGT